MPTPHHLRPKGNGGTDDPSNLLRLCFHHHLGDRGWHVLGRRTWFARYGAQLEPEAAAKVRAVVDP